MGNSQEIYDSFVWKEFVVGDLFIVEKGQRLTKNDIISGDIPYVSSSSINNGVDSYISNDLKTWENKITTCSNGEPGISFYHPYIFSASDNVNILTFKNKVLTPNLGVFLCTCLEKLKEKYSYGKLLSKERLTNEKIQLPITESGDLDFEGMEQYMELLREEIAPEIAEIDYSKTEMSLDESEGWSEFLVGDLFTVEKGTSLSKENQIDGDIPFITATASNNGVGNYISNEIKRFRNAVSVASNGEPGVSFYHSYEFSASGDVAVLKLKNRELNKYTAVFICTVLEKLKSKYGYGKKLGKERLQNEKIWLPTKNGKVDYDFMEKYIKSLNFSEILE